MAEFPNNRYHVRSSSTPSSRHPKAAKIAEKLKNLIDWNSSLFSLSFSTAGLTEFTDGFRLLTELHESVHDLFQLGSTQQSLIHRRGRIEITSTMEEALDGSLRLLDVCGTVKDSMSRMKTHLRDLQSALRRRRFENSDIESKISAYFNTKKQIKREIRSGLAAIKRADYEKRKSSPVVLPDEDDQLCAVMTVVREAQLITISILDTLLTVISASKIKHSAKQFPILQRWMRKRRVSCDGQTETGNEVKKVDDSLSALYIKFGCGKHLEVEQVEQVREIQNQIGSLEESIQALEDGLQGLFRRLIQVRAALLNILYH